MAWRLEKEINGDTALVIDGFEKGIAQSPYEGHNDMRNANIGTIPGTISAGFSLTAATTSGATLGIPVARCTEFSSGAATAYYILDADGHVFKSTSLTGTWTYLSSGVTLTGASSTDTIWFWKGYLFKTRGANVDYYSGGTWTNAWKNNLTAVCPHTSLVGQDDVVYICNATKVASLMETAGSTFDPATSSTYSWNVSALALPSYDLAVSLAELGTNLLVGGAQNAIYPWNRLSTSFNYPIFCADAYIRKMVTANNNVFVFPGSVTGRGRIFITNGSQISIFQKMPDSISGFQEAYYKFYDAIYHRNSIVFGCEVVKNSDGSVLTGATPEIWAIDCDTKVLRGISSVPGGTASGRVLIPDQSNNTASGYAYMVGVSDGSTHGIYYSETTAGVGSYTVETDRIPVGTFLNKRTFNQVEVKLGEALQSGESIQIQYETDNASGVLTTFTSSDTGVGNVIAVNFEKSQWLQFLIIGTGNSESSGCQLKEIRIR